MISQIGLTNFKCFKGEHNFPLSKFNLLTGINGKGKSAFLQSLLLMKQTIDYSSTVNYIILNGNCVQLGSFYDVKNFSANNEDEIKFIFKLLKEDENQTITPLIYEFHYTFGQDELDDSVAVINKFSEGIKNEKDFQTWDLISRKHKNGYFFENLIEKNNNDFIDLFKNIQFISADRLGPRNFYERQNINEGFVTARGENVASILFLQKDNDVHELLYLGEDTNTLLQQTEEWLNFIFDGAKISINTEGVTISITYNTKQSGERYNPSNVGFGYSYILPIVVAGLM